MYKFLINYPSDIYQDRELTKPHSFLFTLQTHLSQNNISTTNLVYPNPAINTINLNLKAEEITWVKIFDAKGTEVKNLPAGSNSNIDVNLLPTGVYIVKTQTNKGLVECKFVKSN